MAFNIRPPDPQLTYQARKNEDEARGRHKAPDFIDNSDAWQRRRNRRVMLSTGIALALGALALYYLLHTILKYF